MKSANKFRLLIYIVVVLALVAITQWKKHVITEKKNRQVISLPNEYEKHGRPVDVEILKKKEFQDIFRAGIRYQNKKPIIFLSRNEVTKLSKGQKVLDSITAKPIGQIASVSNEADLSTGLFYAKVQLDKKPTSELKSVDVVTNTRKQSLSVPLEAIDSRIKANESHLWIVDDSGKAKALPVSLGLKSHNQVEILSGAEAGDKIIINGHKYLEQANKVRIRNCKNCVGQTNEVIK